MSTLVSHALTNHHGLGVWRWVGQLFRRWHHRYRIRHDLALWSERELRDIGLSRSEIAAEIEKPFWRA